MLYGLNKQLEKSIKDHWIEKPLAMEVHELHITEGQKKILENFHYILTLPFNYPLSICSQPPLEKG